MIREEWAALQRHGLVTTDAAVLYREQDEQGKTTFVHIFTWKSHDAPDNVPADVEAIWTKMQSLVEPRGGHRGIEHPEVERLALP